MEYGTKTILLAVFILLIAIVSFNFTGMTGETIGNRITTMELDKNELLPGETITLTITPGSEGVSQDIDIYRENGNRYIQSAAQVCGSYKCKEKSYVEYQLMDTFEPDTYYFRVYDLSSKEYIKAYFTAGVLYQPVGPSKYN